MPKLFQFFFFRCMGIIRLLLGLSLSVCAAPFVETAVFVVLFPDVAGNAPDPALPQDGRVIAVILQNLLGDHGYAPAILGERRMAGS